MILGAAAEAGMALDDLMTLVRRATKVFSEARFQVDVLKVEVPVDLGFVEGFSTANMSRNEAMQQPRRA